MENINSLKIFNPKKKPSLYDIAAKIITFCDEIDKAKKEGLKGDDQRGLEV